MLNALGRNRIPRKGYIRTVGVALICLYAAPSFAQNPATSVNVDANANRHAISPNIYGFGFAATSDLAATNFTMNRSGGNGTSTYNWQLNASNHDSDWYFESILDPPETPGYDGDNFISLTRGANVGAQPMLTIPMINYLANLGAGGAMLWSFSVKKYGAQTGTDPYQPDAGNGVSAATGKNITGNNPLDANTPNAVSIQTAWVQHLIGTWGTSANGGLRYYIMDNEPSIWSSTHRDIHPAGETYSEMYNDYVAYAGTVRTLDPGALIVGPEEWGWWAQFLSGYDQANGSGASGSDYNTHNHTYYYPWLLQQLNAYQQSTGKQLLNVLSVHYYPQELSNSDDDSLSGQLTRNQSTRSLWDPNYVDPSWINQVGINGGIINLIPNLKSWVSQYYPGLQTAITEYNWGDETHLNGATTQADVLGIFGQQGLDLATRWTVPVNPSPTYLAMQIYRNYDGKLSTFGDTGVTATVVNPDNLSSFAAVRSSDGALTVMVINKQQGTTPVTISLANFGTGGTAQAWQIASATQTSIAQLGSVAIANNAISTTVPSQSITLFVIPSGNTISAPSAPTGLSATVASGAVTLAWSATGGATSYNVKRGVVSGGPYQTVGTVTTTTFADSGLTNGVTYYYVVSGTNTSGTSPNSAELSATPILPPTFSSSAVASPNPVGQGIATNITATVTCTANSLSNGIVQILVLDPSGNTAATQNFTAQSFTANQTHTYPLALTPSSAGTYTVEVGVFSATWQQWNWNAAALSITVNSAIAFTSSVGGPSAVVVGGTASLSLSVTDSGTGALNNGNVELQIFDKSGTAVATNVWSGQNFTAGQNRPYSYSWTPAASLAGASYSVDVGVFDSAWSTDYYWNTDLTVAVTTSQFSISGQVTSSGGALAGVTVALSGSASNSTVTNASGSYSFAGLAAGGAYTVTPTLTAYTFSPPSQTFTNLGGNQTANFTASPAASGLDFYPVTPCRIADTRSGAGFTGQFGPPSMAGGMTRTFIVPQSACGIPGTATAYALNFTVVPPAAGPQANLTTWPTGLSTGMPNVSTLNYAGSVVANAAIVPAGTNGAIDVYVNNPTDVLFDINGYFAPQLSSGLAFYPVTPCRIADTRTAAGFSGEFGPPSMTAGGTRTFPIPTSACGIPATASAYSLNFTVVPPAGGPQANLTTWPAAQTAMPNVSTLNYSGSVVANAAIVPAGTNGAIDVYANYPTNLLFDTNGYFAQTPSAGWHFYPVTPCRVADTRAAAGFAGQFGPPSMTGGNTRTFVIPAGACGIPQNASAYSLNFTVIPPSGGPAANLTTWPVGVSMPNVSTLNYYGSVVANAAIVPAGTSGAINVYVNFSTDLLFDINGYFAP